MARVIALLQEARSAGLEVRRDREGLVIRGPATRDRQARELLAHKRLVLAVLEHEDECRGHERYTHHRRTVDWWCRLDEALVCSVCHPSPPEAALGGGLGARE
jgi:hypothetical protein